MENKRIGVWPATGVESALIDLYRNFGENVRKRFPPNFIQSYHYDMKTSFRNNYIQSRNNQLNNKMQTAYVQQVKPRLTVIFDNKNNNQEDAAGGAPSPFVYPLVQGVHPDKSFYLPIYKDPNNIEIYLTHKRVKTNFEIIIETKSIADQENTLAYCENLFKTQYGSYLENVPVRFILPNTMMETIYRLLYFDNLKKVEKLPSDQKQEAMDLIFKEFNERLKKYSSLNGIYGDTRINKNEIYYLYRMMYGKVYFQIEGMPEKTDGERIGSIFDKFTVTLSGFMEYVKPISYLLYVPEVISGNLTTDVLEYNGNISYRRNYNPPNYMKYYKHIEPFPEMIRRFMNCSDFKMIFIEKDICVDSPSDYIDIVDWLYNSEKDDCKIYSKIIKELDENEFYKYFKPFVYEENTIVEESDLYWDGEILHISLTDSTKLYKFYLLCDVDNEYIKKLYNKYKESEK